MIIEEFDPAGASEADFRARWEAEQVFRQERDPEDPAIPFDKYRESFFKVPSYRRPKYWTAWDHSRRPLGLAGLDLEYVDTNRHLAWLGVDVLPEFRRQGIGTALLREAVEAASADGRTLLGAGTVADSDGDEFCRALGFEPKLTERKSQLVIDQVDRGLLETWVAKAVERADDYELVAFDDRCPDDLLEAFVALRLVTNTAPRDDLDMEDEVETPERYREAEEKALERGDSSWRLIARQRSTGQLAGFTEFFFNDWTDEVAWQGWTAVDPTHRNLGLGRWLKAANCLRLMDEKPAVKAAYTWNAFSNGPMLGINIEMGFELLRGYTEWQAATDQLASAIKEQLGG